MTEATQTSEDRRRFLKTVPAAIGVAAAPTAVLAGNFSTEADDHAVLGGAVLPGRWTLAYAPLPEHIDTDNEMLVGEVLLESSRFGAMSQIHSGDSSLDAKGITVKVHGMQGVNLQGFKQARIDLQHQAHCQGGDVECTAWSAEMAAAENNAAGSEFYVPLDGSGLDLKISLNGELQTAAGDVGFEDQQSLSFSTKSLSSAHKLREGVYAIGLPFDQRSVAGNACVAGDSGEYEVDGRPSAYLLFSVHRAA